MWLLLGGTGRDDLALVGLLVTGGAQIIGCMAAIKLLAVVAQHSLVFVVL